jgi:hypothetical protein
LTILKGETGLPLDKAQPLAKVLQIDQKLLFRLAFEAYFPSLSEFLDKLSTKINALGWFRKSLAKGARSFQ